MIHRLKNKIVSFILIAASIPFGIHSMQQPFTSLAAMNAFYMQKAQAYHHQLAALAQVPPSIEHSEQDAQKIIATLPYMPLTPADYQEIAYGTWLLQKTLSNQIHNNQICLDNNKMDFQQSFDSQNLLNFLGNTQYQHTMTSTYTQTMPTYTDQGNNNNQLQSDSKLLHEAAEANSQSTLIMNGKKHSYKNQKSGGKKQKKQKRKQPEFACTKNTHRIFKDIVNNRPNKTIVVPIMPRSVEECRSKTFMHAKGLFNHMLDVHALSEYEAILLPLEESFFNAVKGENLNIARQIKKNKEAAQMHLTEKQSDTQVSTNTVDAHQSQHSTPFIPIEQLNPFAPIEQTSSPDTQRSSPHDDIVASFLAEQPTSTDDDLLTPDLSLANINFETTNPDYMF